LIIDEKVICNKNDNDNILISIGKLYNIKYIKLFLYKHLIKWNILVIRGKKTNKYFVSTGEGMRKKLNRNLNKMRII